MTFDLISFIQSTFDYRTIRYSKYKQVLSIFQDSGCEYGTQGMYWSTFENLDLNLDFQICISLPLICKEVRKGCIW